MSLSRRPSSTARSHAVLAAALVAACMAGAPFAVARAAAGPPPSRQPAIVTGDDPMIVQAVAAGRVLPAQRILQVERTPATFVVRIVSGAARFTGGGAAVTVTVASPGWLVQPAIRPGPSDDVSVLEVRGADGTFAADSRSVFTTSRKAIRRVQRLIDPADRALLDTGEHHYVLDLRAVRDLETVAVYGLGPATGSSTSGVRDIETLTDAIGGNLEPSERAAWAPGHVVWAIDAPAAAGWAVKPEGMDALHWAAGSGRDVDGLYRTAWGCCTAFRIPNGCIVTILSPDGGYEARCNLVAWLAGKRLTFIDPCELSSWPQCPLP